MWHHSRSTPSVLGYWPFSLAEVSIALGILGLLASTLVLLGASPSSTELALCATSAWLYIVGLLAHCSVTPALVFVPGGAERGSGYVSLFRDAQRSLLLMHVDDDCPSSELTSLYTHLMTQGVQIRRIVIERASGVGTAWAESLPEHPALRQVFIPGEGVPHLALSFAVIDEQSVVVALPGTSALDNPPYQEALVLRHLVHLKDQAVAAAFIQTHEALWKAGAGPALA